MTNRLRKTWESRAPRERALIVTLVLTFAVILYVWLVFAAGPARMRLRASVTALQGQALRLDRQATELERLRVAPALAPPQTDLRTMVQAQAGAAGLLRALVKIDTPDADRVVVVFAAVAFADWLNWVSGLESQQIRLDACRIEAMSTPGMVGVTATLLRAGRR